VCGYLPFLQVIRVGSEDVSIRGGGDPPTCLRLLTKVREEREQKAISEISIYMDRDVHSTISVVLRATRVLVGHPPLR
jgi:hypothetical protein